MAFTQAHRLISLSTPLGKDVLLLESFTGIEAISTLFRFQLFMQSEDPAISCESLVGQKVTISLILADGSNRHFNGYCRNFSQVTRMDAISRYQGEVVPWLWFLTLNSNHRIFQNKTVPEMIMQILEERGYSGEVNNRLQKTYEPRDYCVQYGESDFAFVSRLMEEEGIFYFFEHSDGNHKLILADTSSVHETCPGQSEARFHRSRAVFEEDTVLTLRKEQHYNSGKYTLADYHFLMPSNKLTSSASTIVKTGLDDRYEVFEYPGYYARPHFDEGRTGKVKGEGDRLAKLRMESVETQHLRLFGTSTCRAFTSGYKFALSDHPVSDLNTTYLITSVSHEASSNVPDGGMSGYSNSFAAIPADLAFRPPRVTPKPAIASLQTAVVVGPSGEEIHTDKYGRVKVQFHWDRKGQKDEKSSCWVRVAQPWAGKRWGAIWLPRIGQEVVVSFLEGDPDQPMIIGSLYNAEQMPPYELPANQTQSGIKSRSSKGGGTDNFNELRFEDKKGSEDIYFHAEKDFHRVVEHDDSLKVGNDQTIEIKKNRTETVKEGNEQVTIEKGNRLISVDTGNDTHQIEKGNRLVSVDTGNDTHQIKQGNRTVEIDMGNDSLTIKMGNQTTKLNLGKSATEAMQAIELKVGANSIKIDQTGITLKGIMIKIEGQAMTQIKAPMTQVNGDAMLQLKGGITMIG